jgi:hypothetical protein
MTPLIRRTAALATTLVAVGAIAGCGGSSSTDNVSASGTSSSGSDSSMSGMDMSGDTSAANQKAQASTMQMRKLGTVTKNGMAVELDVTSPLTFEVYSGDRLVKHAPAKGDNAHLMLLLSDSETRDRLPDSTITARITDASGKVVASGPQYPMIGMGMGIHYGDNISLPGPGSYTANLVVGPPRIGRHSDTVNRWNTTTRMTIPFKWTATS